jgi:hypothetical protein
MKHEILEKSSKVKKKSVLLVMTISNVVFARGNLELALVDQHLLSVFRNFQSSGGNETFKLVKLQLLHYHHYHCKVFQPIKVYLQIIKRHVS